MDDPPPYNDLASRIGYVAAREEVARRAMKPVPKAESPGSDPFARSGPPVPTGRPRVREPTIDSLPTSPVSLLQRHKSKRTVALSAIVQPPRQLSSEALFLANPELRYVADMRTQFKDIEEMMHPSVINTEDEYFAEMLAEDEDEFGTPHRRPPHGLQQDLPEWKFTGKSKYVKQLDAMAKYGEALVGLQAKQDKYKGPKGDAYARMVESYKPKPRPKYWLVPSVPGGVRGHMPPDMIRDMHKTLQEHKSLDGEGSSVCAVVSTCEVCGCL